MTEIERLMELLEQKDQKIAALERSISKLDDKLDERDLWAETAWTRHETRDAEEGLLVPRLEMRWERDEVARSGFRWRAVYSLVYRHVSGQIIAVPLGMTRVDCEQPRHNDEIDLPFRDGVHMRHDAEQLQLPAFAVLGDKFRWIYKPGETR